MLAEDSEGNKVELFTNKVLPVDKDSKDTKELKGNLVGISNVAKYERARRELRPYVLLVEVFWKTYPAKTNERGCGKFPGMSLAIRYTRSKNSLRPTWGKRQHPPWLCI